MGLRHRKKINSPVDANLPFRGGGGFGSKIPYTGPLKDITYSRILSLGRWQKREKKSRTKKERGLRREKGGEIGPVRSSMPSVGNLWAQIRKGQGTK